MGGFTDEFNNLIYEHGKYCGAEPYTETRKLRKFKDSLEGTTKYSTIMDISTVNKWDIQTLQEQLRIKEVLMTPHNHKVLFGIKQRRQDQEILEQQSLDRRSPEKPVPEDLKLPFEVHKDVSKYHVHYKMFRDLITSGKISEAKKAREKILEVWEKKNGMKAKREEVTADDTDVEAMSSDK